MRYGTPVTMVIDHARKGHAGIIPAGTNGIVIDSKKAKPPDKFLFFHRSRSRKFTPVVRYLVKFPDGRKRWLKRKMFQHMAATVRQALAA